MRLKHIKIAGFKSFVDPTTLVLPENMTCIVGPNGCGKSNTIDAVRWVMGESSAKYLRGDAKTDVIFAGSVSRKPVSQASVELLFDNSENRIIGEYASYNEIAVKRVVTRDGQSQYYLNNTKCRRRDVTELFLGTGLGPRSYAIIEQGMISNLITAKPEELRAFLEEAAGISKYKERRKETEQRMTRTRENLDRLYDIREELTRQLKRLEKQAENAKIYKELQSNKRRLQAELTYIRQNKVLIRKNALAEKVRKEERSLDANYSNKREAEAGIEAAKVQVRQAQQDFYDKQQTFYQVGTAITKLEEAQKHQQLRRNALEAEQLQARQALETLQAYSEEDEQRRIELQATLAGQEPELEILEDRIEVAQERFENAHAAFQTWQEQWQSYVDESAQPKEESQVARVTLVQHEKSMNHWSDKKQQLQIELDRMQGAEELRQIESLKHRQHASGEQLNTLQEQLMQIGETVSTLELAYEQSLKQQNELQAILDQAQGRYTSLHDIHERSLRVQDSEQATWLAGQGVGDSRLAQCIDVEKHWQSAIESLFGSLLTGLVVDTLNLDWVTNPCPQRTYFLTSDDDFNPQLPVDKRFTDVKVWRLQDVIQLKQSCVVPGWLNNVYLVETEALAIVIPQLQPDESVLTPDGQWLGPGWACLGVADETPGLLVLQHDLDELQAQIAAQSEVLQAGAISLQTDRDTLNTYRQQLVDCRQQERQLQSDYANLGRELSGLEARAEQLALRRQRIETDLQEAQHHLEADWRQVQESRKTLEIAVKSMAHYEDIRLKLESEKDGVLQTMQLCQDSLNQDQDRARTLSEAIKFASASLESLNHQLERSATAAIQHQTRLVELQQALVIVTEPQQDSHELPELLKAQQAAEQAKIKAKEIAEHHQQSLQTQERAKLDAEQSIDRLRTTLEGLRIQVQAEQSQLDHLVQALGEYQVSQDDIELTLPAEASEVGWQASIAKLEQQVSALGAINLAAVDEFEDQQERKRYMDEQYADLESALFTLEAAIETIDQETRERFNLTYNQINEGMGALFPKLFGGGHAQLQLVGDDILTSGIAIMARPPGKKNTNIHMLSGGEKALTAISLVFAIFQLNPSPFCMLDEVDAPLDDANVGRYADMVKHMSEKVQFIYISHNKIAMEKASQLMGVTMQEPGVSRLVSVDIGEASALAAL